MCVSAPRLAGCVDVPGRWNLRAVSVWRSSPEESQTYPESSGSITVRDGDGIVAVTIKILSIVTRI